MNRREHRTATKVSGKHPHASTTRDTATLYDDGLRRMQAGRYLDAQICCERALEIDPNHADTLHLMGGLSFHAGQYDLAVEWFSRAIRQSPKAEYLSNLGIVLQRQGRHDEALKVFDKAVQLKPGSAAHWKQVGGALVELKRLDEAVLSFRHALELDPRDWAAACKCGELLQALQRPEEALSSLSRCNELNPNHAPTLHRRAQCFHALRRYAEALADAERMLALDPTSADACNMIGVALEALGRDEEALGWFDRAIGLRPDFVLALDNKAVSLRKTLRFDEAIATYDRIWAIDPDNAKAEFGLGSLHLLTGNFEAGWAGREARWRVPGLPIRYPKTAQPVWLGKEPIDGKTLMIYSDEGLGDVLQFARYVPMAAQRGAQVILVVQDALIPLLSRLPGVSRCLSLSTETLPAFDFGCPMMSLPLAFGTRLDTIPPPVLPRPAPDRRQIWQDRLGRHDRLRVGLVCSGNPTQSSDHNRSMPLRTLAPLLDVDATFISLQKDPRPADKAMLLERTEIIDLTEHLADFEDTAALVSCLDLVVTVCTSVAHLAGALGCPTWIMLAYAADYRWLLDRDDSPWYPSVRLFRQTATRDYADVVERIRAELIKQVSAFEAGTT